MFLLYVFDFQWKHVFDEVVFGIIFKIIIPLNVATSFAAILLLCIGYLSFASYFKRRCINWN